MCILEAGKTTSFKVKESISIGMDKYTKASFETAKWKVEASITTMMALLTTMVTGKKATSMERVFTSAMKKFTKDNGNTGKDTGADITKTRQVKRTILESGFWIKSMEEGNWCLEMEAFIKVNSNLTFHMGKVASSMSTKIGMWVCFLKEKKKGEALTTLVKALCLKEPGGETTRRKVSFVCSTEMSLEVLFGII
jgi:hypothetical protein